MIQEFESDFRPPLEPMVAYYQGGAIGKEWACVRGSEDNTDNEAIDCARRAFGRDWLMPVFETRPADWGSNPKASDDGKHMLWLLVRG